MAKNMVSVFKPIDMSLNTDRNGTFATIDGETTRVFTNNGEISQNAAELLTFAHNEATKLKNFYNKLYDAMLGSLEKGACGQPGNRKIEIIERASTTTDKKAMMETLAGTIKWDLKRLEDFMNSDEWKSTKSNPGVGIDGKRYSKL